MRKWIALGLLFVSVSATAAVEYEVLAEGLDHPWSIAFLPDGTMLVTERAGHLRVIRDGRLQPEPVAGVPDVFVAGQGGLFEVLADPDFENNQVVYLTYAHGDAKGNATRVARARFEDDTLVDLTVIFTAEPLKDTPHHYGGRMAMLTDGTLLVTIGDGFNYRERAQTLDNHLGKIVRILPTGGAADDNPFVGKPDALPEIFSYGHRNPQGIVLAGDVVYAHEHGPQGGDELNVIEPGENYGWPAITYGLDYTFARVTPYTELDGMRQPIVDWTPSIAPSGMTVYDGDLFPQWTGDLFVTTLVDRDVKRIDVDNGEVVGQESMFTLFGERLRDIRVGPDGALYVLTDSDNGRLIRATPIGEPE